MQRALRWVPVLAVVAVLLRLTLTAQLPWTRVITVELCWICSDRALADVLVNIMLFLPLGLALRYAGASARVRWLLPFLLALGIEFVQLAIPGRYSTLSDLVANTIGGVVGGYLPALLAWWRTPGKGVNGRFIGAALTSVAILVAAAALQRPRLAPEADFAHWVPQFERVERWTGQVDDVRVAGRATIRGWLPDTSTLVRSLALGAPLTLSITTGAQSRAFSPIFALTDPRERVSFEVGQLGPHLLLKQRHLGAEVRLASAATRFENVLEGVAVGESIALEIVTTDRSRCLTAGNRRSCVRFPSVGGVWRLLYAPDAWSVGRGRALDFLTLALLTLPAGLLVASVSRRARAGGALIAVVGLVSAPTFGPVSVPGFAEALAVIATIWLCWRLASLRATPPLPRTRSTE